LFVMLNPSTADGEVDDPTIRRCVGFAQTWGYGALEVVNLYAYRTTLPVELGAPADPVGPLNDSRILEADRSCDLVVCAWGNNSMAVRRAPAVLELFRGAGTPLRCLGLTKSGQPRHPLYLRRDLRPIPWSAA
jgi:hypothetical protein